MKKTLILIVALIIATTTSLAQQVTATLNHNDTLTVFYGVYAFREACTASSDGDIITLSPGKFAGSSLSHNVTIIGAGMQKDSINNILPTIIMYDYSSDNRSILLSKEVSHIILKNLKIYNISVKGHYTNIDAEKCYLNILSGPINFLNLINCHVEYVDCKGINAINSYILNYSGDDDGSIDFTKGFFNNCIIHVRGGRKIQYSTINNSIIHNTLSSCLGSGLTIYNTLYLSENAEPLHVDEASNCWSLPDNTKIFKENTNYELLDEISAKYIGTDGKEIGIYGGVCPFSPFPKSYQIIKCDVASETTPDGKLSVHIEVKSNE